MSHRFPLKSIRRFTSIYYKMLVIFFEPHPPFSRPAAGSGFFESKTSKLLRCWTRYYAGAGSQYLARARAAHQAGRAGRGGQGGGGLLLAAVQGIRAGDQARRRGAGCCSSGGRRPHRGGAEVCPGRTDPQRGEIIQRIEGGALLEEPEEKENRQGGPCGLLCLLYCLPLFSLLSGGGVVQCGRRWRRSAPRFHVPQNAAGVLSRGSGAVLSPCREGDILST